MVISGKGFFTWKIAECEGGNSGAVASLAKSMGLTHVLVKIANGMLSYNNSTSPSGPDEAQNLVQSLKAQGIGAWGWHYVYGNNPAGEATIAIQRIQQLDLDGYVIDAEAEYKQSGKRSAAKRFMTMLRSALPNLPMALSSYRFPTYHPDLPWREFLEMVDYNMPQVYWMQAHNAGEQLKQSLRQFQNINPFRPFIATGAAFRENGWQPTPTEVLDFLKTAKSLNISAVNFWEWSDARKTGLKAVWETIRDFSWDGVPVQKDICEQLIDAYNAHDVNQIAGLYTPTALHITAARTIQGITALCTWYNTLFTQLLPNSKFILTGHSGTDNSRHFTWTATSSQGKVLDGNDTLGLIDSKIGYHFSSFTVTS